MFVCLNTIPFGEKREGHCGLWTEDYLSHFLSVFGKVIGAVGDPQKDETADSERAEVNRKGRGVRRRNKNKTEWIECQKRVQKAWLLCLPITVVLVFVFLCDLFDQFEER